jgi:hypothetical protein
MKLRLAAGLKSRQKRVVIDGAEWKTTNNI